MSATAPEAQAVLDFWFGPAPLAARPQWFTKSTAFDTEIRERFGALIEAALRGGLDAWQAAPETALARVLVLDQFTRNAFRDTPRAFAGDAQALAGARDMVRRGFDQALAPLQRVFAYLPFEHAEDLRSQEEALRLYAALSAAEPSLADNEEWAKKHHVIIQRFGRFPHRNALLGRASTPEEVEFLKQPGSRF
ncbi:DUF924 family protein [Azohydromonas caseinilytica]|uniref:DUF924 domain-containing protein n=1 Tax=Azohydromonas caseinilytica TaxID=2728836 RepID=A0A848F6V7_9BURK|nr:DUF924 family protein [Azohydromonas caseinilytica]NML14073.1 DUF924 domain-containing protein [Azohydromonas caseinilytica]